MKVFLASILVLAIGAMTVNGFCGSCECLMNSPQDSCVNGNCVLQGTDPYCSCTGYWEGPRCDRPSQQQQVSNPCAENPCLHSSYCQVIGSSYTCTCVQFYTGTNCETETELLSCSSSPCTSPKTHCTNMNVGYHCSA